MTKLLCQSKKNAVLRYHIVGSKCCDNNDIKVPSLCARMKEQGLNASRMMTS